MSCQFCGSKEIQIKTPYLDRFGEQEYTFCCLAQKKNAKYSNAHTSRFDGSKPSQEEVGKW